MNQNVDFNQLKKKKKSNRYVFFQQKLLSIYLFFFNFLKMVLRFEKREGIGLELTEKNKIGKMSR